MPAAKSDYAFPDCREFMNKAIASEKGWRVRFEKHGPAVNFRMRCYTARRRELTFNKKFYGEEDLARDRTVWDGLVFLIKEAGAEWEVIAVKDGAAMLGAQVTWEGPLE